MKYIIFTGPTASGKDTIMDAAVTEFNKVQPKSLEKAWYYTTRKDIRPGEKSTDEPFLTEEEFDTKLAKGEILLPNKKEKYRVGYPMLDLKKPGTTVLAFNAENGRKFKAIIEEKGGEVLMVYIYTKPDEQIRRIMGREGLLFEEMAADKAAKDNVENDPEKHRDYDLVIENKEGELERTKEIVFGRIKEFIESDLNR